MNVVLVEPEIPPNTGNIARLCAATKSCLHLIDPLGFRFSDKELKRAGMDYWQQVEWFRWANWDTFVSHINPKSALWFIESNGPRHYAEVHYGADDYLVFGRETAGLPKTLFQNHPQNWLRIPMFNSQSRSLNLSNCVALVLYEALRQSNFINEIH